MKAHQAARFSAGVGSAIAVERDPGERQAAERDAGERDAGERARGEVEIVERDRRRRRDDGGAQDLRERDALHRSAAEVRARVEPRLPRVHGRLERNRGERDAAEAVLVEVRRREADRRRAGCRRAGSPPSGIAAERDRGRAGCRRAAPRRVRRLLRRGSRRRECPSIGADAAPASALGSPEIEIEAPVTCRVGDRDPVAGLSLVAGGVVGDSRTSCRSARSCSGPGSSRTSPCTAGPCRCRARRTSRSRRRSSGSRQRSRRRCRMRRRRR